MHSGFIKRTLNCQQIYVLSTLKRVGGGKQADIKNLALETSGS